jgi:hypothetical protein
MWIWRGVEGIWMLETFYISLIRFDHWDFQVPSLPSPQHFAGEGKGHSILILILILTKNVIFPKQMWKRN